MLIFVFSTAYFIKRNYWCSIGSDECVIGTITPILIAFNLLYETVLCLQCVLSFYIGALKSDEKFGIFMRMEKMALALFYNEKIIIDAKQISGLFFKVVFPGTFFMVSSGLYASLDSLSYINLYREIKTWFAFFAVFIWEWKYAFFASTLGNLFDELNKQIQV